MTASVIGERRASSRLSHHRHHHIKAQEITRIVSSVAKSRLADVKWIARNRMFHVAAPPKCWSFRSKADRILADNPELQALEVSVKELRRDFIGYCHGFAMRFVDGLQNDPSLSLSDLLADSDIVTRYTMLDLLRAKKSEENRCYLPQPQITRRIHDHYLSQLPMDRDAFLAIRCWKADNHSVAHTFSVLLSDRYSHFEFFDSRWGYGLYRYPSRERLLKELSKHIRAVYPYFLKSSIWNVESFFLEP